MLCLIVFCLIFHHYVIIIYLIPNFKKWIKFDSVFFTNSIFQMFYFCYFRFYKYVFFQILIKYSQVLEESNFLGENCIILLSKYYLIDAMCSALPAATTENLDSLGFYLGLFNFFYQVLVLYYRRFDIFRVFKKLLYKILRKNHHKTKNIEKYLQKILCISLNDVLIIICSHMVLWYGFEINLNDAIEPCRFTIFDYMKMKIENLILIFIFNFVMLSIILTKKPNICQFFIEREYYSIIFQIYDIILLHYVFDSQLQYYFESYHL